jgi:hypothetical protein
MLKVDLHAHTADDPVDYIPHTTTALIDHAANLGFDAIAVTLHDRQLDVREYREYARERGVVLIPGVERTICGKHVLLLDFPPVAASVNSFEEVARLKARFGGLVVAPHPFYPAASCLRGLMDRFEALFDAVEISYFYTRRLDFNRAAARWAERHGRPLVGNSDTHMLSQVGKTYSMVDAAPDADAIVEAIRQGRVDVETEPLAMIEAASFLARLALQGHRPRPTGLLVPGTWSPSESGGEA